MKLALHRKLLMRLLMAWIVLSVTVGGWVYYRELEGIDEVVLDMAKDESEIFTGESVRALQARTLKENPQLVRYAEDLLKQHFQVVELYDADRNMLLAQIRPDAGPIEAALSRTGHGFPSSDSEVHEKHLIDGSYFLRVVLPLIDRSGNIGGYFEGVYEVDEDTLEAIHARAYGTVILTSLAILVTTLLMYPIIIAQNRDLLNLSHDLLMGNVELMRVLGSAIAKRDSDTNVHNYRVTIYAIRLGEALGLPNGQMRSLIAGAFLHDVGKIGLSDSILLKGAALSEEEVERMHSHVQMGVDIVSKSKWLQLARDVIEFHHEHYDGSGYVRGLKGREIPFNARIFAIVDVFDALTSQRVYKKAWTLEDAMARIASDSGRLFDPDIVSVFQRVIPDTYREVTRSDSDSIERLLSRLIGKHFYVTA